MSGKDLNQTRAPGETIGRGRPAVDAQDRLSGRSEFVDDLRLPGRLHGRFLVSPFAHARIVSIDTGPALALPGVHAVITGKDTSRRYGILPIGADETALAVDKVRFAGQQVAAVAAASEEIADAAIRLIEVEYEELPALTTAAQALADDAPRIHEHRPGNIEKEYHHVFGSPEAGFAAADLVVEDCFYHPRVTHAALEPHGTVARYEGGGRYVIWTSTQTPRHIQRGVATALDVPESSVRVVPTAVGGGFGGKSETFPHDVAAALLARLTARPVRFRLSREEVFALHRGRPESHIKMRLALRRDGRVLAVECETIQDGGAFCSYGVVTILYSGALLAAIYDIDAIRFDGYRVITNKPSCGPMRGHGTIGARHAFESLLERAASELSLDPAELRRRNLLQGPTRTSNDLRVTSYGYPECLERVVSASGWEQRHGSADSSTPKTGTKKRGLGIGSSHYVSGASNAIIRGSFPHTTVLLQVERDGSVTLFSGACEIGQGATTTQAMIVAETLGIPVEQVRVVSGDTGLTPIDLGSYASRVTFMAGNAVLEAAEKVARRIRLAASRELEVDADRLELRGESARLHATERGQDSGRERRLSFLDAVRAACREGGAIVETGTYTPPPDARGGRFPGAGVGPGVSYSYAAQVVEVEVDTQTGEVEVLGVWAAHDCGRALNPLAARGQVAGSVWMGLGQALSEGLEFTEGGLCLNAGLLEYKVPTAVESPPVEVFLVESGDPEGPFGAKEVGEGSLAAVLPAFTNAIHDAVGVWITSLPATPERILAALEEKRAAESGRQSGTSRGVRVPHPVVPPSVEPRVGASREAALRTP